MVKVKVCHTERQSIVIFSILFSSAKRSWYFFFFFLMIGRPPSSPLFPYTTLSRFVLLALLAHVLATTIPLRVGADIEAIEDPLERLIGLLRQEMARLSTDPRHNRLFFEFWNEGKIGRAHV